MRGQIEQDLEELLAGDAGERLGRFREALGHALLAGGKRVRPQLTHLFFRACGGVDAEAAKRAALAIELLHSYTLVHDDLPSMDNDVERRGEPSVWAKYGEGMAILVGDWLQARAFSLVAVGDKARAMAEVLGRAALGVIHGQVADIAAAEAEASTWDEGLMEYVFRYKTGALMEAACELGVIAAGGEAALRQAAVTFGRQVGVAFQYVDDLLDAEQGAVGNEFSALRLLSGDAIRKRVDGLTAEALGVLGAFPGETEELAAFAQALRDRVL